VHACGPYPEPELTFTDVEGGINFTDRFDDLFGSNDCGLHWSGASGWCFYNNHGAYSDFLTVPVPGGWETGCCPRRAA
jgi:hypothetical protein